MLFKLARVVAPAVLVTLVFSTPAFAQKGGGQGYDPKQIPKKEDIEKEAEALLAKSESQTATLEGFAKLTYKAIPTSIDEIMKQVGEKYKGQAPKAEDVETFLHQFQPQIQEALNKYLDKPEGWKFEALEDLKWKSKKIPKGEYDVSLVVDESQQLRDFILSQPEKKDEKGKTVKAVAIQLHFKPDKKQEQPFAKLKFELKGIEDKKTQKTTSFDITSEFFRALVKTSEPVKLDPPKDAAKKDDTKKDSK